MDHEKRAEQNKRIRKEYRELAKLLPKIAQDRRTLAEKLMHRAAFMKIALEDLEQTIAAAGYTEKYQNGENQYGVKKSASVEVYNTTIKNYAGIMEQIGRMLPDDKQAAGENDDGFDDFVAARDGG